MTSNQQCCEVAERLRGLDMSDIEVDGCIIDSPKYVGLLLMRMLDAACDYRDGLHYFPGFFSAQAVVELFADLIDPTCEIVRPATPDKFGVCSACGALVNMRDSVANATNYLKPCYCPNCGSRVVRRND